MVVTDGRQRGYSVGMTNFELAQTMVRLGAVTAMALDAGGSSTMAFDGTVLNRPSDPAERPVSECLCLLYSGVYAPPTSEPVLSPNGDGVDETQALSYKLTRLSTVSVQFEGPNRAVLPVDSGPKAPGVYRFSWDGSGTGGGQAADGRWELSVSAVDDRGLTTSASRGFLLNRTLAGLSLQPSLVRVTRRAGGKLAASFNLSRPARVTVRVETRAGAVVAVASRTQLAAGAQTLTWNGRAGRRAVRAGTYVLRVIAVNEIGSMDLTEQFRVRR
jgi:flagellar hook assembly protein FlgD